MATPKYKCSRSKTNSRKSKWKNKVKSSVEKALSLGKSIINKKKFSFFMNSEEKKKLAAELEQKKENIDNSNMDKETENSNKADGIKDDLHSKDDNLNNIE